MHFPLRKLHLDRLHLNHSCRFLIWTLLFLLKFHGLKNILDGQQLAITIKRLAHQILENNPVPNDTVIIGLQPRGVFLSDRIMDEIRKEPAAKNINYGKLDITFLPR